MLLCSLCYACKSPHGECIADTASVKAHMDSITVHVEAVAVYTVHVTAHVEAETACTANVTIKHRSNLPRLSMENGEPILKGVYSLGST